MKYRKLGDSDLEVSEISLGSWLTYGVGVEADKARACLDEAFEQGINFIDTANIYGRGAAETSSARRCRAGRATATCSRPSCIFPMSDTDRGLSRAQVEKQLDASLKRLRTDYVDLYQCHRYDYDTPLEETMEALTRAVESGKTRYIGFSEWPADQIQAAIDIAGAGSREVRLEPAAIFAAVARARGGGHPALRRQRHFADRLVAARPGRAHRQIRSRPAAAEGLARGERGDGRLDGPADAARVLRAVQQLKPIAEEAGLTLPQFALAWVLREPNVASAIIGASRPEQVRENAAASGVVVDTQLFLRAETIVDEALEQGRSLNRGGEEHGDHAFGNGSVRGRRQGRERAR